MKFAIPATWQDDFLPAVRKTATGLEIYGKLNSDFFGGSKPSFQLPRISRKKFERSLAAIHQAGFKFNYLLDSTCIDNLEWTIGGQRKIRLFLDWLSDIGIDVVTVAVPYLLAMIKSRYPGLRVSVSVLAGVNSIVSAKYWENFGADRITLLNTDVNRDFALLRKIRETVDCELRLIANSSCLYRCPFYLYRGNMSSHSSQANHRLQGFSVDYCRLSCRYRQIVNPVEFIRSPWIRPEDVGRYEKLGIDSLELADCGLSTACVLSILRAYLERKYDGNLADLFPAPSKPLSFGRISLLRLSRYFSFLDLINIAKGRGRELALAEPEVYIDNRKLEGFLDFFENNDCNTRDCRTCGYCAEISRRVLKIEPASIKNASGSYRRYLEKIFSGSFFEDTLAGGA
ncbi:MAG: U32 family peptidase [Candidatus Omnitrophica bacterium]|nr:U32 family peptidase [Candidatus Omnitrophota bacterium]MDD5501313.1 U32 family peptidase [Candidatus Omnitrophota bacterium]